MSKMKMMTADEVIGIAGTGIAGMTILRKLIPALRAKGVFSDIEIAAILDAARGSSAVLPNNEFERRMLQSVRQEIDRLQSDLLKGPSAPSSAKH